MKTVNLTSPINSVFGEQMVDVQTNKPVTLETVLSSSLLATLPQDVALSPKDKLRLFRLSLRIVDAKEIELTDDEVTLIMNRVAACQSILATGRVAELLGVPL